MKKILVPLDGSPLAESVLPYVAELARCTGAQVQLLIAVSDVALWDANATVVAWEREEELALGYIEAQREALESNAVKVTTKVVRGDPAQAIANAAKDGADLVALCTHGRSGISRWLLGSVAGRVLENSETPCLIVRPPEKDGRGGAIEKILVPLDGSPLAESVFSEVEPLAKACGSKIIVMQSVPPLTAYPGVEAYAMSAVGEVMDDLQAKSKEYLGGLVGRLKGKGLDAEAMTSNDLPTEAILAAADAADADLIAIATHGRSGLGRVVLGSVADAVIRRSHRPCLVIRPTE